MARCKDCFHFDVCMDYTSLKDSKFAQNFNETDILCDHFKRAADVAEVRHGTWIQETFLDRHGDIQKTPPKCSSCGAFETFKRKYCPNCGACMDGKGESDGTL